MFELAPFALPADYGEGVVPLSSVKAHCSIDADDDEFDAELGLYRDAAVDMVERYCGIYLAEREGVVWKAETLPTKLRLGVGPIVSIDEGAYLDAAGADAEWDVSTLRIGLRGEVVLRAGQSWPTGSGFAVTFTAGYADDERPPALVQAVLMFTAHLFANRESVQASGTIGGEVPLGFRMLCSPYSAVVL